MKLFITGASGFIGKNLVGYCRTHGIDYAGVDTLRVEDPFCSQEDINSPRISERIPEDCDAVIHLAGLSSDSVCRQNEYQCFQVNVMGTLNMMMAAAEKNVKQFIFASTEWVYDSFEEGEQKTEISLIDIANLRSEYALSKLVSERNLSQKYQHGFCPVTVLRFGIVYGRKMYNGSAVESLFNTVNRDDEVSVGSLKTCRCFIHVSDVVTAIIKSVGLNGFEIINIQGDTPVSLKQIIDVSAALLNRKPIVIERSPQNVSYRNVSNLKAKRLLSWAPRISLKEGLESLMDA